MFPCEKAWDFLIDINKFSTCLPGIDEVKQIDDKTFDGIISANGGADLGEIQFSFDDSRKQAAGTNGRAHRRDRFGDEEHGQCGYDCRSASGL